MKRYQSVPAPALMPRLFMGFDDTSIERLFKNFYTGFYYRFAQASLGLGLLLVFGDFLVDYFAYPDVAANFYRLTICAPILFGALAYSFHAHAKAHWELVMSALIVFMSMVMFQVLLNIDAQGGKGLGSWVGILNFTILELYCFVILGARFLHALPSGLIILVGFEYAMYLGFEGDTKRIAYSSYHAITMGVICAMIGWWREYLLRKNFAAEFALRSTAEGYEIERSLLEATLDASNNGILVVDNGGTITSANRRFAEMWRIPDELIARGNDKKVLQFALEQLSDPQQFIKKVEDLYQRPEATSRDKLHFADGRIFSRYSHPQRLRDQIVGRVWSFQDITDRIRGEERVLQLSKVLTEELERSENHHSQLQTLLQAIPDMVWMKNTNGIFLSCNAAYGNLIGAPIAEVIGKSDADFVSDELAETFLASDRDAAQSKTPIVYEQWVEYGNEGRKVLLETTKVAVHDKEGKLIGVLGVARDVTVMRGLMRDLKDAKETAQQSNEAKSLFLANMSHEIRTPMNAIIGMSDLALNTELTPRQRNYIQKIKLASDGLMHIINDILDFSKIEAGKMQLESIPFELDDVFEGLSGLMALRAESQGIELAYNIADSIPALLVGDSLRLGQVLTNLVSNALKFSSGGNVVVSVQSQEVGLELTELHISVMDEGIGMTDEQASQIFQPFSQADLSTTRRFGGTGLGLAICHHLVSLLGGRIWVESALGVGSTFHFTAQFKQGVDRRKQGIKVFAEKLLPHAQRTVLVVDDNPLARQIMINLIGQIGLQVIAVANGKSAHALTQVENPPDIIACLVDWHMPEMDGIQTIEILRSTYAEKRAKAPPMILVTAHSQDDALRRVLPHVDGLLTKPASTRNLCEELARCIGMEGAVRQRGGWRKADRLYWPRFHNMDILLVEDTDINREVICELLTGVGLTVRLATNGLEAIEQVNLKIPDLVLMDCHMPVMDGFTATRHLRSDPAHAHIIVIALTASATAEDKRRCLAAGMNAFVTKPLQLEDLYEQMVQCFPNTDSQAIPPLKIDHRQKAATPIKLPDYPGIDVALGLAQVGGRIPLFMRVLKKFRDNLGRNFEGQFSQAIQSGDWQTADRLAHSLKGICRTLGASDLADITVQLEVAVGKRNLPIIEPHFEKVIEQLNFVCKGLIGVDEGLHHAATPGQVDMLDGAAVLQLEQLAKMLAGRDAEAVDFATDLAATLAASKHQSRWSSIYSSIERYDFSNAESALHKLISVIKLT